MEQEAKLSVLHSYINILNVAVRQCKNHSYFMSHKVKIRTNKEKQGNWLDLDHGPSFSNPCSSQTGLFVPWACCKLSIAMFFLADDVFLPWKVSPLATNYCPSTIQSPCKSELPPEGSLLSQQREVFLFWILKDYFSFVLTPFCTVVLPLFL